MARPKSTGLTYFPFDVDFIQDIKIRKLIKYQRGKSISVYALLLCLIYKNGYYMLWDEELPFILSEQTGFEEAYIREVIKCCLSLGLFSKDLYDKFHILTSRGIQERYLEAMKKMKRKSVISEYSLVSSEETMVTSEETQVTSGKTAQKKKKGNKIKNSLSGEKEKFPPPEVFEKTLQECHAELSGNESWMETVSMNIRNSGHKDFTPAMLLDYLGRFFRKLQNEGETHKSPKDAMAHFSRWLNIELQKKQTYGTANRSNYTSKQEANAYALERLQQHKLDLEAGLADQVERPF